MHIGIIAYMGLDWHRQLYRIHREPKEEPNVHLTPLDMVSEAADLHRWNGMIKLSIVGQGDI